MGVCYYLIAPEHRVAFDLGKGWGDSDGFADIVYQMRETGELPTREVFDRSVRISWRSWAELSKEEYGACAAEPDRHRYWKADRWVWDAEGGCYIIRNAWYGREDPSEEEALRKAREDRAYAQRIADKLWAFCQKYGPHLELINDAGDLPWWEDGSPTWRCVGSRFDPGDQYGTEDRPLVLGEK